ncbi:MAG: hypothetical protein DI586_09475 [Micavibrio aeruginosavorus]|uniref:Uncharacterized protein n=1 Tax=Micavibrio aeruginosavorus TaxID=349221 RepID=A0A2W5HLC0_9BACT|nr:MAG: hypothetical protein DI586_09475 [Micavibrio aeruginosavorus]
MSEQVDYSLAGVNRISNDILKAAIKVEKINQKFFWAASEMVTPEVNLRTAYSPKANLLKIMSSDKAGGVRDAFRFIEAMEQSYALGAGNISPELRHRVSEFLNTVRDKHPSPEIMAA